MFSCYVAECSVNKKGENSSNKHHLTQHTLANMMTALLDHSDHTLVTCSWYSIYGDHIVFYGLFAYRQFARYV